MRSLLLIGIGLLAVGCVRHHHSPRVGIVGHGGHVRVHSNANVNQKRHEWFQGLYRDCVESNVAMACFKTGQNIEDGVVAPPSIEDSHWFYAKACDLQNFDDFCYAADRTGPQGAHPESEHRESEHSESDHHHDATPHR